LEPGIVLAIVLAVLLVLSVPIAMCLGLASLAAIFVMSPDFLIFLPQKFLAGIDSFTLLAIPLFILAGTIMGEGGIAHRIIDLAMVFVGRLRGGLGMVSIISTMFFSGVCGSASADTAAIGSVTIPAMKKKKYPGTFATAIVAAAGGTSQLVPPSIDLIIIGIVANISIGGLFAAGFLPGIV
jgi:C4-dicarboxylate transporter DctM subunit